MSTTAPTVPASFVLNDRLLSVVRLHFVNRWSAIYLPWSILGFILLVNAAVWAIIGATVSPEDRAVALAGTGWSGASFYFFVYMMVLAVQAVNTTFPFAQGYGVTRRDFYLGTAIAFGALALAYGAAFTVLAYIEEVTGGWGLGGRMFTVYAFGDGLVPPTVPLRRGVRVLPVPRYGHRRRLRAVEGDRHVRLLRDAGAGTSSERPR